MKKLFYEDTHITEFEGTVVSCHYDNERKLYKVLLDQTAFFPEEGGQSPDLGILDGQEVLDVQIESDLIYHYVSEGIEVGSCVKGNVDWNQRFDFMQQHSGEHILSGLIHKHFGYNNVGFHLSVNEVTMDFDGAFDWKVAKELELEANQVIYQNLPIEISYPDKEALASLEYRSKIEIDGQVRIVTIPGVDICACCAPHVGKTGEIGMLKIVGLQSYKGGVRLNILCGQRALMDYSRKQDDVSTIAQDMSSKQDQIVDGYLRLKEEVQGYKTKVNELQEKYLTMSLNCLPPSNECSNALLFTDINDNVAIRNAVNKLVELYDGYCAVFTGKDDSYRFVAGSKTLDCNELAQKLRSDFSAKCGGNKIMIQGSIETTEEKIRKIFE